MNTATVWHMVSTRPSEDIFSIITWFMEKGGKAEVNHQDKGNGKQVQGIEGKVPFQIF